MSPLISEQFEGNHGHESLIVTMDGHELDRELQSVHIYTYIRVYIYVYKITNRTYVCVNVIEERWTREIK